MGKHSTNGNFETAYSDESDNSTDFLTIPDSLITYARDTIFSTWQILERQLKQTDSEHYPEMYTALEKRTEFLFNIWLQFEVI